MKKKIILYTLLLLISNPLFSQIKQTKQDINRDNTENMLINPPVQALYTNILELKNLDFNKRVAFSGKGESLDVVFELFSQSNEPLDLYIFVIATYEKVEKSESSFQSPIPERDRIKTFVPFPNDIKNFQYLDPQKQGKIRYIKYPKKPKDGVEPFSGKPYSLTNRLIVKTHHLSKYRNNYFFFNEVTILIFDSEGKPLFRQLFTIKGVRR